MMQPATQQTLALACKQLADEIAHGPAFFDEHGKITSAVERYTGERLTKDAERCAVVAALKLLRYSDRQIAEVVRCDVRSIPLMVTEIEKSGAIPALKERLIGLVGANAEQGSIAYGELVQRALGGPLSIEMAATLKAIGSTAKDFVTLTQLLTGAPTEIRATINGPAQAEVDAWAKANAITVEELPASPAAKESESTAAGPNPLQMATEPPPRHPDDTRATDETTRDAARTQAGGGSDFAPQAGNH